MEEVATNMKESPIPVVPDLVLTTAQLVCLLEKVHHSRLLTDEVDQHAAFKALIALLSIYTQWV